MAIVEESECQIDYLDIKGKGVSLKTNVTLPYTLPGEIIEYEKHQYRKETKSFLKKIVVSSPNRVEAPCKYFGHCGGCSLQHLNDELYKEFKYGLIRKPLEKEGIETQINDLIILKEGQRRRVNLEVIKKDEKIFLGFHRSQSHQIVNIDSCLAMMEELSSLIMPLKELFDCLLSNFQKAQVYLTMGSNGIDLTIRPLKPLVLNTHKTTLLADFAKENNIIRLNFHNSKASRFVYETEVPYIILDNEVKVEIEAHGFLQSSFLSDQILQELVLKFFKEFNEGVPLKIAVDLFCGRGTFTFALSRFCRVHGFDSEGEGLKALRKATLQSGRPIDVFQRDLFSDPLTLEELNNYGFAVLNPPRSGAETQVMTLAASNIPRIVYISCSPETFARDARILITKGYKLKSLTPVDQFYWSHHLEVVGYFIK